MLSLRGVGVTYGSVRAVDGVHLDVHAGERVALVGPSGAGKSTLLGLCAGTVVPDTGGVRVLGHDLQKVRRRQRIAIRRRIGIMHQSLDLIDQLRVVHNVNAGRLGQWSWWRAMLSLVRPLEAESALHALASVGIPEKLHVRTDRLSGGERQRVALARVLVQRPDLVLGDEPVASLDPARAEEVMRLLSQVVAERERALVVSLHDFDLALRWCDRIVGLRDGRICFDRAASDVDGEARQRLYELQSTPWPSAVQRN